MKSTTKSITTCITLAVTTFALVGCTTSSRYGRSTGQYLDDKTVTKNVKHNLKHDSLTKATQINVETFRGNVHLTGLVDHPIQKERANDLTSRAEGVQYFRNDIIVKNQLPTARVAAAVAQQNAMREGAGAQNNSGQNWQPGTYNPYGPVNEPAGSEMKVEKEKVKTDTFENGREIKTETDVEVDKN